MSRFALPHQLVGLLVLKGQDEMQCIEPGAAPLRIQEIEKTIRMLKNGKFPGVDNIPAAILKRGGLSVINALTVICRKSWTSGQSKDLTQSVIIPLPKKATHDFVRTMKQAADRSQQAVLR